MSRKSIAMLVGSIRKQSINLRLAKAIQLYAPASMAFRYIRMDDMPFYNGDLEPDRPDAVRNFTNAIREADGVCCVTPEYNRSIPALLKNAIDWGSKPPSENVWNGKVFAMTGASPGSIGTAIGQQHLRQIMAVQGSIVMPGETYISFRTPEMISEDGVIADQDLRDFIAAFAERFAQLIDRMA
ncbi:NADPH-dependent FMN reductase [Chachezhania sediminis]|uniref:NADPH-dependent FMN reductase n=1 Tax=Chachezhania sediminis TaxID=2599291 RepID=UPI00131D3030|nr:NADPH-dependent FMN reductase [Chachezhania sediminis]